MSSRPFEIGSITKTMTATVLAWLVVGGEIAAENTLDTWLDVAGTPAGSIKLSQLATHTSGLPRLAPNHTTEPGYDPTDPYANFDGKEVVAGLRAIDELELRGTRVYSNYGYQILGLCIEQATLRPLSELFRTVIFEPLGMTTASTTDEVDAADLLGGTRDGVPVPPWHLRLMGPGGVVASVDDLLRYGLATASPPRGRLGVALELAATCQLGWSQLPSGPVWHNGGTAGCRSMLAVDREQGRVVTAFVTDGAFDAVDEATMAACRGRDPMDAIPSPIDPDEAAPWISQAIHVVRALHTGDLGKVRSEMDEKTAAALTTELLTTGRASVIEPLLPLTAPRLESVHRTGRTTQVRLRADSENGDDPRSVTTTVMLDDERRVVGLRIA